MESNLRNTLLDRAADCVLKGDPARAEEVAREALRSGLPPLEVIERGFARGIREAGSLWEAGEYFLPQLVMSAEAMKTGMEPLKEALASSGQSPQGPRVIIGTVEGDIHDIGKTIVATLLEAHGFQVRDLGADVPVDKFVEAARETKPALVCMSALLTTTMVAIPRVIRELESHGLRKNLKVLVGGAPLTREYAREAGADGYGQDAVEGVREAMRLCGGGA